MRVFVDTNILIDFVCGREEYVADAEKLNTILMISDNKRIAKNTLFLYVRMLFKTLVTFYTSRVILEVLGVEDFGIYNVVAGIVALFAFVNSSMAISVQRYL